MALSHDEIGDLVTTTTSELGRMKWTDLSTDLQDFEVLPSILRKNRVTFEGGDGIDRNVMLTHSGAAKHVGLFNTDDVNVDDVMGIFEVPYRHTTTNWGFDRREKKMNRGPEQIVDLIKVRRADALISLAVLLEEAMFDTPAASTDNTTPWGLDYWVVVNSTTGFNGGAPFDSTCAGLNCTTYPRWRNYTAQYVSVSKQDLIKKMRTAYRKTNFKSPINIPDYYKGRGQRFRIYVNEATISDMEDIGESQNENLGRDLASMDGAMTFRRNPLIYVPHLDNDSTNPIYGINWGSFQIVFLRGEYMRETPPMLAANQHNVYENHIDMSWNLVCTNRRSNFVMYV